MNGRHTNGESGVRWRSEMPEHWEVRRLEQVASYRTSNVDKKVADGELPVRLCNYTDVYYHDRLRAGDSEFMRATALPSEIERFRLQVGDVLITKDSENWRDIAVPALIEETADDFVCGYHLGILRSSPSIEPTFLFRALQCVAVNQQFQVAATGVTRYGMPNSAVGNVLLPLPPLDEQRDIAAFLDRETARIDSLIAKKRLLIERLQEYRTALITRTVTRGLPPEAARASGLDPSPRLKPSGMAWLGDVPDHWDVRSLRRLVSLQSGATPSKSRDDFWDGDIPWVSPKDMKRAELSDAEDHITAVAVKETSVSILPLETVLVVVRGMILAHSFPVAITRAPVTINQDMKALRVQSSLGQRYLYWALVGFGGRLVALSDESAHGTRRLTTTTLGALQLPLPPRHEQDLIVSFLANRVSGIDGLLVQISTATDRLQEYRSALIAAAVTGKIDVRDEDSVTAGRAE